MIEPTKKYDVPVLASGKAAPSILSQLWSGYVRDKIEAVRFSKPQRRSARNLRGLSRQPGSALGDPEPPLEKPIMDWRRQPNPILLKRVCTLVTVPIHPA
ncbi:hypothetical protein MSC49_37710 (plasmid) [Methylosinus sp. C49]|jgi:hypothetical protein|uniref:hypothetical protein n=1 Tax=Methylosinus sp. C49 TaxID=2699395 RepID=UPI001366BF7D|nr:hypothetical protein [Methylosinus sp. C49]BBU63836.1 hypothetical protein MSC49_37710 [Methylosinus sp. C49]